MSVATLNTPSDGVPILKLSITPLKKESFPIVLAPTVTSGPSPPQKPVSSAAILPLTYIRLKLPPRNTATWVHTFGTTAMLLTTSNTSGGEATLPVCSVQNPPAEILAEPFSAPIRKMNCWPVKLVDVGFTQA